MDGANLGQPMPYDYRMYDRIWQRVSPDLTPYPELRGSGDLPSLAVEEGDLPGADRDPCCMGTAARESQQVLVGFLEEELAQRCCYLALARRLSHPAAAQLLRRMAAEKAAAAGRLKSALYLITGQCHAPDITVDARQWSCVAQLLRGVYHQEACLGLNYARAGEETTDLCLGRLLGQLSREAYCRAEAVMELLGRVLGKMN